MGGEFKTLFVVYFQLSKESVSTNAETWSGSLSDRASVSSPRRSAMNSSTAWVNVPHRFFKNFMTVSSPDKLNKTALFTVPQELRNGKGGYRLGKEA